MLKILAALVGVSGLVVLLAYAFQDRLVFFPDARIEATPDLLGLEYETVWMTATDGVRLHGWFVPAPDTSQGPVALFFHGNAGNISHRLEMIELLHSLGLASLLIDYRGYGRSRGSPSEPGLYRDAEAAWSWLVREKRVEAEEIICWGRSLGGPVAAWLASHVQPGALIVESTFTSLPDIGQKLYPFLPVKLIARLRFPTESFVSQASCPVLIVHSADDEMIPFLFGKRLYEAAPEPKTFLPIKGGHNEGFMTSGDFYKQGIKDFLQEFGLLL